MERVVAYFTSPAAKPGKTWEDSRCLNRDSKPGPSEYEATVTSTRRDIQWVDGT